MKWRGALLAFALGFTLALPFIGKAPAQQVGTSSAVTCNKAVIYDRTNNGTTEVISPQGTAGTGVGVFICGFIMNAAEGAVKMQITQGQQIGGGIGSGCSLDRVNVTPAFQLSPNVIDNSPMFKGLTVPAGRSTCITTNASSNAQAIIFYTTQSNR